MSNFDLSPQPMPGVPNHSHPLLPTPQELAAVANNANFYTALAGNTAFTTSLGGVLLPAPSSPTTIDPDDATVLGTPASGRAYGDHQHQFTTNAPAALTRTSTSTESSGTGFARDAHVHSTAALGWGEMGASFRFTSSTISTAYNPATTGPPSPFVTTDFAISNVVVDATRLYRVTLSCPSFSISAASRWCVGFFVGGTGTGVLARPQATTTMTIPGTCSMLWRPSSGTVSVDVRVARDNTTAASTFTFEVASSGVTGSRDLYIEDIGPR